ncbi:4-hydroxythreonine-4-phosphate dehydrogenase PdxA [candidate division LCP-89 bacterium B3_LCP]|uniref:4-hydroxythreonine-4-phosphate dehydrogenase PdxA n=1 Tax=candidate division LCP-89 bacterium B3_LCP TaxID=2012998 RepID=A0A532URP1_UNCL8|nr:MAG: 4-hydroxythreonine-4-phosphate dehydrogenase PdxA [candidate division LCP-89 bacterium B3_LCP]
MEMKQTPIYINCGDPNGIGPEVTLKALLQLPAELRGYNVLAGVYHVLERTNKELGNPLRLRKTASLEEAGDFDYVPVLEPEGAEAFVQHYGKIQADAGAISAGGIKRGVEACLDGEASALVTAPSSKESLHLAGFKFPGQTEMIATLADAEHYIMILTADDLRIGIATTHLPLREVSQAIDSNLVAEKIKVLYETLQKWFGIEDPLVAVTALNPHSSDGGIFGDEEGKSIVPAIKSAQKSGITVAGPFPADTVFNHYERFDCILTMYHDQGMIPIKMKGFGRAVNITGGLPFPRTSPDHGTAFDIAGKFCADPGSMLQAILTAHQFVKHIAAIGSPTDRNKLAKNL